MVQFRRRGKSVYKAFQSEAAAVSCLRRLTRLPEARLLRCAGRALMQWSCYKGVSWHRGNQKWVAQHRPRRCHNAETLGVFDTQLAAARAMSRRLGVTVKSLKKPRKIPRQYAIQRIRLLAPVFQSAMPGDLSSAMQHGKKSARMFAAEPVLEFVSIMSKYGPFKDSLLAAWHGHHGVQGVKGYTRLVKTIGAACVMYSKLGEEVTNPWIAHCGRNVSHHQGPLPLCRRLGILLPCPRSRPGAILIGKSPKPVRLASGLQELTIASAKLRRINNFMQAIKEFRGHDVTTCRQWRAFVDASLVAMEVHKPPGLSAGGSYSKLWFARSLLIAAGTAKVKVEGVSVEEFRGAFPDAKAWLSMFKATALIKHAMAEVKYSGPPELFTMMLCMVGSKDMNFDAAWLEKHVSDIAAVRQAEEANSGLTPTPGHCCFQVLRGTSPGVKGSRSCDPGQQ